MDMLAVLLLSAFAVYGFFSLVLSFAERLSDALAVRVDGEEDVKGLSFRCALASRQGRETVILLEEKAPSEEILSLGYAVYLRVSEGKGDRKDGDRAKRA